MAAQQVSIFCSKAKLQMPTVKYEQAEGSQEPSCTCKVTLHAYFDADKAGFPEMTFQESARNKKASKAAAMTKAHEFLASTAAYKKVMGAAQVGAMQETILPFLPTHRVKLSSPALNHIAHY